MEHIAIESSWKAILSDTIQEKHFKVLGEKVRHAYQTTTCYPPEKDIFNAFNLCPFSNLKVVIIGQDPYHGPGQAHGLSFSVPIGVTLPPSLINIFKELATDLKCTIPEHGNLTSWAKQGVLLLNATLTVEHGKAGSHQAFGWETFTDEVIKKISEEKEFVVFLLWGGFAKNKAKYIDKTKHLVLTSGHPSPLSANRGHWFGNKHFSQTNQALTSRKLPPITWDLSC